MGGPVDPVVYRTGTRWHWTRPVAHRPGIPRVTCCTAAPVRAGAPVRAPNQTEPELRCRANGCRQHWPEHQPSPTPLEGAHRGR